MKPARNTKSSIFGDADFESVPRMLNESEMFACFSVVDDDLWWNGTVKFPYNDRFNERLNDMIKTVSIKNSKVPRAVYTFYSGSVKFCYYF